MNKEFEFDSLIKKMAANHQPELPSPGLIWWRAQILKKQQQKERIERPGTIMRMVAAVACLLIVVGLCVSQGHVMWKAVGSSGLLSLMPLLLGGAALAVAIVALMWWTTSEA